MTEPESRELSAGDPVSSVTPPAPPPRYRIYSPAGVGWATAFGSPLGGGILMAFNYWRWGNKRNAWIAFVGGLLGTVAVFVIAAFIPDQVPSMVVALPPILVMVQLTRQLQGTRYREHLLAGGNKASNWKGVGVGALCLVVIMGGYLGYAMANGLDLQGIMDAQHSVDMGHGQEVYYSRGATREAAQRLGEALKAEGYFAGENPASVILAGSREKEISFVVAPGIWNDEGRVLAYRHLVEKLAPTLGGKPITLRLLDESMQEKKRVRIE